MACLGSMLLYWYHWSNSGKRIAVGPTTTPIGGHFLHLLRPETP